jgi:hypothetical protein
MAMVSIWNPRKANTLLNVNTFFGCILELGKVETLG